MTILRLLHWPKASVSGALLVLPSCLDLAEDRRLFELEPQVEREQQQERRHQERNAPAPVGERFLRHRLAAHHDDDQRQEEADASPWSGSSWCRSRAASRARARRRRSRRRRTRRPAPALASTAAAPGSSARPSRSWLKRGKQADEDGREAHDRDGDQECVFAADDIADAAEHERAERPHQEAGGVGREAGHQRRGVVALGKEQRRRRTAPAWRTGKSRTTRRPCRATTRR